MNVSQNIAHYVASGLLVQTGIAQTASSAYASIAESRWFRRLSWNTQLSVQCAKENLSDLLVIFLYQSPRVTHVSH